MRSRPDATRQEPRVRIVVDGDEIEGVAGQSVAGVMLGAGIRSWRQTANTGSPRGLFCGIGICFDCLVTVDGVRDVRACQRRAIDGAVIEFQRDASARGALPADSAGLS